MIYLALNILFSSAFTLVIKWVTVRQREDIITVGPINYITAALLIAPQFFLQEARPEMAAAVCGGCMGAIYFTAFFFVSYAIRHVGAAPTTVVGGLSLLLPILVAAFLWEETPNLQQCFGIGFAVLALSLMGVRRKPKKLQDELPETSPTVSAKPWLTPLVLSTFFLLAGSARLTQRTLKHVLEDGAADEQRATFLFVAFAMASLPSIVVLVRRKAPSLRELGMGVGMGASNILQTHFILKSLELFEGYIVFPISSAGGLIVTTFVATRMLGEKLTRQTYVGIGIATVALVLLNWVVR